MVGEVWCNKMRLVEIRIMVWMVLWFSGEAKCGMVLQLFSTSTMHGGTTLPNVDRVNLYGGNIMRSMEEIRWEHGTPPMYSTGTLLTYINNGVACYLYWLNPCVQNIRDKQQMNWLALHRMTRRETFNIMSSKLWWCTSRAEIRVQYCHRRVREQLGEQADCLGRAGTEAEGATLTHQTS